MNMGVGMSTSSAVISAINTDIIITINYALYTMRSVQLQGQILQIRTATRTGTPCTNGDSIDPAIHFTLSDQ